MLLLAFLEVGFAASSALSLSIVVVVEVGSGLSPTGQKI
jgi:hypothetical protein